MSRKVLINASNLHVGGGVQVATSVIGELTLLPWLPKSLVVWVSKAVDENLRKMDYNLSVIPTYCVINTFGLKALASPHYKSLKKFDAVLTIFGPLYAFRVKSKNITGFAQPWIIYPENEVAASMSWWRRQFTRLKFEMQSYFFKRADHLIVELEHVRYSLLNHGIGSASTIHVVRNSLSSLYTTPSNWMDLCVPDTGADIRLGFVGRNYAHKNTAIFPEVINLLRQHYGINVGIYVTFTKEEWAACNAAFRAVVTNIGPLFVAQCPNFYKQMDGVIFPSLLECFSATPLEAMAMEKPLFASDRPFNRDVCQGHAHYFDPLSPESAARTIATVFLDGGPDKNALAIAREHAVHFSNARERAEKYLTMLIQADNKINDLKEI